MLYIPKEYKEKKLNRNSELANEVEDNNQKEALTVGGKHKTKTGPIPTGFKNQPRLLSQPEDVAGFRN